MGDKYEGKSQTGAGNVPLRDVASSGHSLGIYNIYLVAEESLVCVFTPKSRGYYNNVDCTRANLFP